MLAQIVEKYLRLMSI